MIGYVVTKIHYVELVIHRRNNLCIWIYPPCCVLTGASARMTMEWTRNPAENLKCSSLSSLPFATTERPILADFRPSAWRRLHREEGFDLLIAGGKKTATQIPKYTVTRILSISRASLLSVWHCSPASQAGDTNKKVESERRLRGYSRGSTKWSQTSPVWTNCREIRAKGGITIFAETHVEQNRSWLLSRVTFYFR